MYRQRMLKSGRCCQRKRWQFRGYLRTFGRAHHGLRQEIGICVVLMRWKMPWRQSVKTWKVQCIHPHRTVAAATVIGFPCKKRGIGKVMMFDIGLMLVCWCNQMSAMWWAICLKVIRKIINSTNRNVLANVEQSYKREKWVQPTVTK